MTTLSWRGDGTFKTADARIDADAIVLTGLTESQDWSARYTVEAAPDWQAHTVHIDTGDGRALALSKTDKWGDGCAECTDPDLSASPMTNTLPIRRLDLKIGDSAEILALHIMLPDLTFRPAHQRYTRLGPLAWRYEGLESGFTAEIAVDGEGFVTGYPGLFLRVDPGAAP
ncbi:MAG: putative glycolipid-binding domain-containing protein [Rhodobacter sp.]|nr:putative glycolipid-binding domain-containing protein [Rhodobacter sp.]